MATHSSTLAWKIPWMEEPGRLQSMPKNISDFPFFMAIQNIDLTTLTTHITFKGHYYTTLWKLKRPEMSTLFPMPESRQRGEHPHWEGVPESSGGSCVV